MQKDVLDAKIAAHKEWVATQGVSAERIALQGANLWGADLEGANLRGADLRGAKLGGANLRGAELSNAKGLLSPIDFIKDNFETTNEGVIVYKIFGLYHEPNSVWKIKAGSIIEENVDFDRTVECGCGVNVATRKWLQENVFIKDVWRCLIRWEWLVGICVPYNTNGKIRASKVQLLDLERGM